MPTITGRATDYITFSRASNATVTDSSGFIKWAGHNLLTNSESFGASAWTKSSATVTANTDPAPNGTTTGDTIAASGANGTALQTWTAEAVPYTFGVWLRRKTGTGNIQIAADSGTYTTVTITSSWALYTVTQTPAAGSKSAGIRIVTSADEVYAWGAHLYRSDLGGMVLNPARGDAYYPTTPPNLLGYTEAFDNAYWTKDGTTIAANLILGPNGLQTADTITPTAANNYHYILGAYTSVIGRPVTASFYAKAGTHSFIQFAAGGDNPVANFNVSTGTVGTTTSITSAAITSVGNGWYRCSVSYQAGATSTSFVLSIVDSASAARIPIWNAAGTETVYIWGAQLSDSASLDTYSPVYGAAVTSAAYYAPRLDFDPVTLAAKGLLVEEQRTNLLLQSNTPTVASWIFSNTTGTANTTEVPDPAGTNTATKLVSNASGGALLQAVTSTAVAHTGSVWLRTASGTLSIQFALYRASPFAVVAASTITVTSTWQRFTISGTFFDTTQHNFQYGTGTSATIYSYGAQLEAGAFATSYIPTGAATATRSADGASVATSQFPYSTTASSIVANVSLLSTAPTTPMFALSDGTINNFINTYQAAGTAFAQVYSGGAPQAAISRATVSAGVQTKTGIAVTTNDAAFVLNGGAAGTDTSITMPAAAANLYLGLNFSGSGLSINGHIRQITYIPRRLTNAELQARTA